jgi:hypothetical protein
VLRQRERERSRELKRLRMRRRARGRRSSRAQSCFSASPSVLLRSQGFLIGDWPPGMNARARQITRMARLSMSDGWIWRSLALHCLFGSGRDDTLATSRSTSVERVCNCQCNQRRPAAIFSFMEGFIRPATLMWVACRKARICASVDGSTQQQLVCNVGESFFRPTATAAMESHDGIIRALDARNGRTVIAA